MVDVNNNRSSSFTSYLPSFIGAGASLLGGFLSNAMADRQAEKQFERQKKLAEIQQEYNKELMDKQSANNMRDWQQQFNVQSRYDLSNAYNNASRQVQALKQAGLNPASGVSPYTSVTPSPSGGTTSLGASSQGSASMAQNTPFNFGNPVDFANIQASVAQAKLAEAQAENIKEDTRGKHISNNVSETAFDSLVSTIIDNARYAKSQADKERIIADNQQKIINQDISLSESQEGLNVETTAKVAGETNVLRKTVEEIESRTNLNYALKAKAIADACNSYAQAKFANAQARYTNKMSEEYHDYIWSVIWNNRSNTKLNLANRVKIYADLPFYAQKMSYDKYFSFCKGLGIDDDTASQGWKMGRNLAKYSGQTASGKDPSQ